MAFVWEQRKVSEIADRFDNLRVPVAANLRTPGTTPYYGANGIQDYVEGYTHDGEFVLVAEDGANDLKNYPVKCVNGRIWVNNHAHVLQARPQIASNQFLDYSMSQANIEALLVGGGRAKLNAEVMMGIVLRIPRLQEQEVIGGYFYKLDQLITLHQRKRMLRRCFFSIDWEQRKFVEFVKNAAKKNKDNIDLEPYAVTNDRGFIAQKDAHDDFGYMSNVDRTAYNIVPPNSFAYNPARINVGSLGYYEGTENVIVSSLYEVFQTEEYIDDKFLLHWFKSDSFPRWIEKLQEGSVRLYFYFDKLVQCQMMVPSLEEQKRISAYLDSIDQLITLHQCKSNFCKKNEVNAWEQRKLGEVAKYRNGKAHENCIDDDGKYIVVNSKFVSTNGKVKKFSNMQNEPLFENEVAFVLSDVPNGRAIARTFLVEKSDKYTLNQRIAGITPLNETDPYYLHVLMNRHPYFLAFDDGVKQTNLSVSDVMKFESYYPKYEEQETIGRCFSQLDQLITLHQWECNINENTEGNDEKQRKPIKKLIISEGNLSLVDDMFLLHRMTFLVCNKYILLRLNVVKYKITIIIISNILYSIVSLLIIACYLIVINKQLIILIYVEISVVIIKGDDDYARIRS